MASTYLSRAGGTPTSTRKFTISFWVKKSNIGGDEFLVSTFSDSNNRMNVDFNSSNYITFICKVSGSIVIRKRPSRLLRDTNAWYHIVIAVDTTQSTAADRCKFYINGEQETSFSIDTNPSQNADLNVSGDHFIGAYDNDGSPANFFGGLLSHVHYTDGYTYAASTFGETDSTTGEWKINTNPSVTYGTNGYFIMKDNGSVTDQSGQSNNFTLGAGTLTNAEDCPSNVFCTFNPLIRPVNIFYAKTNSRIEISSGNSWQTGFGTLGMEKGSGKYYMEFKLINGTKAAFGIADYKAAGVIDRVQRNENRYIGEYANSYGYHYGGNFYYNGSSTSSGWDSFTTSNIIGMAVDMENMKLYFHKDGTYQNSGNPSAGSGGYSINDPENCYLPAVSVEACAACANWGNGTFDGTAISSEGTNASGIGKFEYDVPTGYTALSTKGLNL